MTVYNSERFLKAQLGSILKELGPEDELVISDDGSTDRTMSIIAGMKDRRIRAVENSPERRGVIQNFQNAIERCRNDIVVLSDHDDVWLPGRIARVREVFESNKNVTLVVCNAEVIDEEDRVIHPSFYVLRNSGQGALKNFVKNSYIGSCMSFRRTVLQLVLPIPKKVPMHDMWIGILNDIFFESIFISEVLVRYRRHSSNISRPRRFPIQKIFVSRVVLGFELMKRAIVCFMATSKTRKKGGK
jgi:glycosyltransferase involved in cell wall biosynthesis